MPRILGWGPAGVKASESSDHPNHPQFVSEAIADDTNLVYTVSV